MELLPCKLLPCTSLVISSQQPRHHAEATPLPPEDVDETPAPPPFPATRVAAAAMALLAIVALAAGANAIRGGLSKPLP